MTAVVVVVVVASSAHEDMKQHGVREASDDGEKWGSTRSPEEMRNAAGCCGKGDTPAELLGGFYAGPELQDEVQSSKMKMLGVPSAGVWQAATQA